jgi:hypothetical protein
VSSGVGGESEQHSQTLSQTKLGGIKLRMVAHTCNPSIGEAEAKAS